MSRDHAGPITVFKTNDPALLAFAQSLLDGADIDFVVAGAVVTGQTPGGVQGDCGIPEIQVRTDDADEARELLKDLA
jgi:hypothetical protein